MRARWIALAVFMLLVAGTGIWLKAPWHSSAVPSKNVVGHPGPCRLPIYIPLSKTGGFISRSDFSYTPVPASTFAGGASSPTIWSYDAQLARWLPTDHRLISPDGNWWMYQTPSIPSSQAVSSSVHLVDPRGTDRAIWSGQGFVAGLGWTAGGAVIEHYVASKPPIVEYWVVDPSTSQRQAIAGPQGEFAGLDATGVWGLADQFTGPPSDQSAPLRWTLKRTDLKTGATATWWNQTLPGLVQVVGFYGDHEPIVVIYPDGNSPGRVLLLSAPNTEVPIASDTDALGLDPVSAIGDGTVVWIADQRSQLWRWTSANGLKMVAQVPGWAGSGPALLTGPCR